MISLVFSWEGDGEVKYNAAIAWNRILTWYSSFVLQEGSMMVISSSALGDAPSSFHNIVAISSNNPVSPRLFLVLFLMVFTSCSGQGG